MRQHADILDEPESLRMPVLASVAFHVAVFGALALSTYIATRNREVWGSSAVQAGDAVAVTSVKTIPLPSRSGRLNPVANDTESTVRQAPKQETKKQAKVPEPDAIPLKSRFAKEQPKPTSQQKYQPKELPAPNQVFATQAPAAVSPMFMKAGAGGVGLGQNTVLGTRFGAYADLVAKRVSDSWQTSGLAGLHTAPLVIVTFDIQRDGSIRNPQIAQRSGNTTLDYSALRAVMDAAPFPPLPPGYQGSQANVELRFQLQR
jgi:protein TonB